jgi:hypothetical protein
MLFSAGETRSFSAHCTRAELYVPNGWGPERLEDPEHLAGRRHPRNAEGDNRELIVPPVYGL